ncbi:hypothetical protein BZG36_03170 [Bifiguratus adelaidae]|uniref:F-box domain-containing protein n=1 Tax=Bifiguratus adelaidae TaxID=1938954 RepID=A0A261Y122_9FUNG|nr:hypothetical protein BZG36_03170 [Bifiguratus adelaidae]
MHLLGLPSECITAILSNLTQLEAVYYSRTCRTFSQVLYDLGEFWRVVAVFENVPKARWDSLTNARMLQLLDKLSPNSKRSVRVFICGANATEFIIDALIRTLPHLDFIRFPYSSKLNFPNLVTILENYYSSPSVQERCHPVPPFISFSLYREKDLTIIPCEAHDVLRFFAVLEKTSDTAATQQVTQGYGTPGPKESRKTNVDLCRHCRRNLAMKTEHCAVCGDPNMYEYLCYECKTYCDSCWDTFCARYVHVVRNVISWINA